ncbi:hypothetical protein II810_01725, partial [bacterium]|nr:hypothetical protein [bacterium]
VYITERPHHFNKDKATESINITAVKYDKEKPVENSYTITGWNPVGEEDGDNTTYVATVTFDKDANYTLSVEYSDEAGNQNSGIDVGEQTAPYEFTVDTHPPEGTITVDNISWSQLFSKIGKILTFGKFKNQTIDVSAKSTDEISDTYIKYYKTSDTTALTFDELEKVTDWKDFKGSELEKNGVSPNERFAIYLKIIDYAGNYSYINSNGYIVENVKSDIMITPQEPNDNGIYGRKYIDGIKVDIKVTDPEIYSGIKTVDYWIECDGKETKRENLFTFDIADPMYEQLKHEFTKSIIVDPNANNSCNTVVYVKAVDNAENEYTDSVKLDIDITAPTVKVVYEDTSNVNAKEGYYTSRTAKVYITERPHHFNADTATKSIDISAQNALYQTIDDSYSVSTWELVGKENNDKTTYVATVSFNKDANYTFNVIYSDNADNFNNGIDTSNQTAAYDFTVDTTPPSGSITINDKSWDYLFSKVKEKLTFGLFKNTKVSVSANSTDVTSGADIEYYKTSDTTALTFEELDKITDWTKFNGSELEKNGLSPNERFTIYLKITDYAGNYIYINSNGHIIDNVKSNIEITPETPNENGIYGYKDYHNGINVDIKVTDPEPYSGIKTIDYWVECDGKKTQEGNLFTFNITNPTHEQLKNEITKSITVDPMINNSCNTVVYVKTVDNAGNEFINHADLDIDMTIPTVKVVYSDTPNENAKEGFYKSRTAKVYITERPHHFNKDKATESIKITSVDYFGNKVTDSYSIGEWNLAGAEDSDNTTYAATVTFDKDANYTFNVEYYDNADNTNNGIDFANQTAPSKFTVDKTKPTGSVTVDNNPWNKLINILTFGLFKNIKVDVSATSSDATSDTYIEYYKTSKADALTVNELEEITDWTAFKGSALEENGVSPNEQFVIYLKITDNAGNYNYISSDGFIVDNVHSVIEISPATANKNNAYGLDYNGNVNVGIKVTDPEPYSGIKTVEYWVECDGKETQRENLFTFNVKAPTQKQLKNEWTGTVTVKQKDNNSTDTKIYVKTIDNAGNEYTQSTPLDIDITEPGIKVTYEDTSNANAKEGFFTSRKATIVITERNNHFDSETATQGIKITAVDANGKNVSNSYTLSDWETVENKEYDKTTHTATIDFNKDANYTFSIEYIDKADNNNLPVDVTGQTTPYKFTVDTNKPTGSITVENNSWAEL